MESVPSAYLVRRSSLCLVRTIITPIIGAKLLRARCHPILSRHLRGHVRRRPSLPVLLLPTRQDWLQARSLHLWKCPRKCLRWSSRLCCKITSNTDLRRRLRILTTGIDSLNQEQRTLLENPLPHRGSPHHANDNCRILHASRQHP